MIDMKLNSTRKSPSSSKVKESAKEKEKIIPIREEKPVRIESPIEQLLEDKERQRLSVFTSGWRSQPKKEKEVKKEEVPPLAYRPEVPKRFSSTPHVVRKSGGVRKSLMILLIIVIVLAGGYFIAQHFEKTTVHIQEKHQILSLSHTQFTASKNTQAPLHFEIMIVSDTDTKSMVLTESQDVSTNAKGTITLYNEYSTKSQNLAIHTQVNDVDGKAYRTDKAVTIPGYKTVAGKVTPGQISVGITAFLPGDSYNGTPTNFTIAGFKGTPKFAKIYAKATTPLAGGAQGLVYTLGATEKGTVTATAETTFKSRLIKKVTAEVPKGYIMYPDAYTFSYSIRDDAKSPTPNAKIQIDGTLSAVIVKESEMTAAVTKALLPDISKDERSEIAIPDIAKANFSFVSDSQTITKDMQTVAFTLSDDLTAIWHPDTEQLVAKLRGVAKTELLSIFKTDPGISEARATVFPPWQKYLPLDPARIHVIVE